MENYMKQFFKIKKHHPGQENRPVPGTTETLPCAPS